MMRLPVALLSATILIPAAILTAQTAPTPQAAPVKPNTTATMQPAIASLQDALGTVRVDKWKASGAVRDQTQANINSIHRDLESTLPPLLANADAAPNSVTHLLPVYNNIGALYDVLLRVASVAKVSAPGQQSDALDQATASLESARHTIGDRIQSNASAQEQQISDLRASLRATPQPATPVVAACPPPTPPAKKRTTKPKPKPSSTTAPAAATH